MIVRQVQPEPRRPGLAGAALRARRADRGDPGGLPNKQILTNNNHNTTNQLKSYTS